MSTRSTSCNGTTISTSPRLYGTTCVLVCVASAISIILYYQHYLIHKFCLCLFTSGFIICQNKFTERIQDNAYHVCLCLESYWLWYLDWSYSHIFILGGIHFNINKHEHLSWSPGFVYEIACAIWEAGRIRLKSTEVCSIPLRQARWIRADQSGF